MKLKNFISKQKQKQVKETKTFRTSIKPDNKKNRASEKKSIKFSKRIRFLMLVGVFILAAVLLMALVAFFYRNYIIERLKPDEIISPGIQKVIDLESARQFLKENNIQYSNFGYASGSADLSLTLSEDTIVYFSSTTDFHNQAEILADIIYSLKSEGKNASIIDLRYNRPIVKF